MCTGKVQPNESGKRCTSRTFRPPSSLFCAGSKKHCVHRLWRRVPRRSRRSSPWASWAGRCRARRRPCWSGWARGRRACSRRSRWWARAARRWAAPRAARAPPPACPGTAPATTPTPTPLRPRTTHALAARPPSSRRAAAQGPHSHVSTLVKVPHHRSQNLSSETSFRPTIPGGSVWSLIRVVLLFLST